MADPLFKITVFKPEVGAGTLINDAFETIVKKTILDRFGKVVSKSKNDKVKAGFSIDFAALGSEEARKLSTAIPASSFRVHLISPKHADVEAALALKKKVAPSFPDAAFRTEIPKGSGLGGRAESGENFAFVQLAPFTGDAVMLENNEKALAAREVAELACHELGHAMGISKNQGRGMMQGDESTSVDVDAPPPEKYFEEADAKIILATLESIAAAAK